MLLKRKLLLVFVISLLIAQFLQVTCDIAVEDALNIGETIGQIAANLKNKLNGLHHNADDSWILPNDCGRIPVQDGKRLRSSLEEFVEFSKRARLNKISSGRDALIGEFPSFVHIKTEYSNRTGDCCGAILNKNYVITTASCLEADVEDVRVFPMVLRQSAQTVRRDGHEFTVPKWYEAKLFCKNPEFSQNDRKFNYDFAVIRLNQSIEFNDYIQPVCLPRRSLSNRIAYSLQYNSTSVGSTGEQMPTDLQVRPVRKTKCSQDDTHKSHVCFESSDPDTYTDYSCNIGSGSPIMADVDGRLTLFGLTSYGINGECESGIDGISVTTNVYLLSKDIQELTKYCR